MKKRMLALRAKRCTKKRPGAGDLVQSWQVMAEKMEKQMRLIFVKSYDLSKDCYILSYKC